MSGHLPSGAIAFIVACAAASGILVSFTLVVVVPIFAWCVARMLHDPVERVDDPRWRAPLAAMAATIPGTSFAIGAVALLVHVARSGCLSLSVGRTVFATLCALLIALLARACLRAIGRMDEAAAFVRMSDAAPRRLAVAASAIGVRARFLASSSPLVVLAGLFSPIVIVSKKPSSLRSSVT